MQGRRGQGLGHVLIAVDVAIDGREQPCLPKMVGGLSFHQVRGELRGSYRWIKDIMKSSLIRLGAYPSRPQPDKAAGVGILGAQFGKKSRLSRVIWSSDEFIFRSSKITIFRSNFAPWAL